MSRSVDLDRLADFVGGALDGTSDAEDVRHLIATDTRWAEAYVSVMSADALVRSELGAFATTGEPMPADVAARLDQVLRDLPPLTRTAPVIQLEDARRRRRRFTIALSTAAAIVVVGFASVVVVPLLAGQATKSTSGRPDAALAPAIGSARSSGDVVLLATGADYRPETLASAPRLSSWSARGSGGLQAKDQGAPNEAASATVGTPYSAAGIPAELTRLAEPAARVACIATIVARYGGRVAVMDLARFQGAPAATVLVEGTALAGAGHTLAVVVGSACGQDGVTSAELYHGVV
jgi:hypothetical protein